jgi:hypothetical protein
MKLFLITLAVGFIAVQTIRSIVATDSNSSAIAVASQETNRTIASER